MLCLLERKAMPFCARLASNFESLDLPSQRIAATLEGTNDRGDLQNLTSQFYTIIPHNIGFRNAADCVISNQHKLATEFNLLSRLRQVRMEQ